MITRLHLVTFPTDPPGRSKGAPLNEAAPGRRWKRWMWWVLVWAALLRPGLLPGVTITRTSAPVFHIDTSVTPTLQAMYVAYQIRNDSGAAYPDVWVSIGGFTGPSISPGPFEDGIVHLGGLAPGETKGAYFFIQAAQATATPESHTITVHPTRPPAGALGSQTFTLTVEESIQANANQVETVVAGPNPPQVGGLVTVTVTGRSGTIGAGLAMAFNPAAYLSWRPDAYELIKTTLTLTEGNSGFYNDTLYVTVSSSSSTFYTAVYSYRTVGSTTTPTPVSPISFIDSGQQMKHTRVNDFAQFDAILPAQNLLSLGKTVAPAQAQTGGSVTFSLILTNGGTIETIVEDFVDTLPALPANLQYVSGSSRYQGASVPDPVVNGQVLTWIGTFPVQSGSLGILSFQAQLPAVPGSFTNAAVSHIGGSQIDTTLDLSDNAPATAIVTAGISTLSGTVFLDTGTGGGTAHDGTINGGETGIGGVTVRLTDETGTIVYGAAVTDGAGGYSLAVPTTLSPGALLRLEEVNPPGHISVSASVGNTGGAYDRTVDAITFPYVSGMTWTNLDYGDVPSSSFVASGQQTGVPGGVAVYAHVFTAGSAGQVAFVLTNSASPALAGWEQTLFVDANCDGLLDAGDPPWSGAVSLEAGQRLCVLVKESIPLVAPLNASDTIQITASFDHAGASPLLVTDHALLDVTIVGGPGSVGLTLVKSADKTEARPGETIAYTIVYANTSPEPVQNMVLHDLTPAYTTFLSATNGPLTSNLTGVVATVPALGSAGALQWSFQGSLAPGQSGFVWFQVLIQQ